MNTRGGRVPPPGEWHPFYAPHGFLNDALNNPNQHTVRVCVFRHIRFEWAETDTTEVPVLPDPAQVITLTRRTAHGRAPYVGRPFHYEWAVLTDHLGRHVTGNAHIVHHQETHP